MHIKDIDVVQKELRDDYIINEEFSAFACNVAWKYGLMLPGANEFLITTKHIDLRAE